MRKFFLVAVLGLAGLGVMGERSEAKAQYPWGYSSAYNYQMMMQRQMVLYPAYRYYVTPFGYSQMYASPAYSRYYRTPYNIGATITSRAIASYGFSPYFGYSSYYSTPASAGWNYSPYYGYRQYYIPSQRYISNTFYSGYVPPGYVLP
jgi:hypothetical protein